MQTWFRYYSRATHCFLSPFPKKIKFDTPKNKAFKLFPLAACLDMNFTLLLLLHHIFRVVYLRGHNNEYLKKTITAIINIQVTCSRVCLSKTGVEFCWMIIQKISLSVRLTRCDMSIPESSASQVESLLWVVHLGLLIGSHRQVQKVWRSASWHTLTSMRNFSLVLNGNI